MTPQEAHHVTLWKIVLNARPSPVRTNCSLKPSNKTTETTERLFGNREGISGRTWVWFSVTSGIWVWFWVTSFWGALKVDEVCVRGRACECVRVPHARACVYDWCCFYYFVRNSLVALLEALCARIVSFRFVNIGGFLTFFFFGVCVCVQGP